jgi:hypothetical protein
MHVDINLQYIHDIHSVLHITHMNGDKYILKKSVKLMKLVLHHRDMLQLWIYNLHTPL